LPSCRLAFGTSAFPIPCCHPLDHFSHPTDHPPHITRLDVRSSLPTNRHVPPFAISPHSPSTFTVHLHRPPSPTAMFRHLPFHHIHHPPSPSTFTVHLHRPPSPSTFTVLTSSPRSARPPPLTALPCRRHSNDPSIPST
jgi:hypothetical protein